MKAVPAAKLRGMGYEKLDGQSAAVALSAEHCEWLEGLGVVLYQEAHEPRVGHVWGPPWLNVLSKLYGRGGLFITAAARCARDQEWAGALLAAAALGGKRAASRLIRAEGRPCRQCHQDYEPAESGDDGFCSETCKDTYDAELGGEPVEVLLGYHQP